MGMTGEVGKANYDRFLWQVDTLKNPAKPGQRAGIATYDKDSKIEQAFAWFFGKTILNVNSARAFLLRNPGLIPKELDATNINSLSKEGVAKYIQNILDKNSEVQNYALDYLKPQGQAARYIEKRGQEDFDKVTHAKRIEVRAEGPFEGTEDQALSFIQHLTGAGVEIEKGAIEKWIKGARDNQVRIPREELDSFVLASRKKQSTNAAKKEKAHTPKEIQAYIDGVKEVLAAPKKQAVSTAAPVDQHDDVAKKAPQKSVAEELQELLKNEEIVQFAKSEKGNPGQIKHRACDLIKKITGIKVDRDTSRPNLAWRLLQEFNDLSVEQKELFKNLCIKSGYFKDDQLRDLQRM